MRSKGPSSCSIRMICGLAMFLGVQCACSEAMAAGKTQDETTGRCERLEDAREDAATKRDYKRMESLAQSYIETCRSVREKDAIAIAMGEVAFVSRVGKDWLQALNLAQVCINFYYLAVECHAEKARALLGLRMPREADEVVKTGFEVADRAQAQADHDIRTADGRRSSMSGKDYELRVSMAKWRLNVIDDGRNSLRQLENQMKAVGGQR